MSDKTDPPDNVVPLQREHRAKRKAAPKRAAKGKGKGAGPKPPTTPPGGSCVATTASGTRCKRKPAPGMAVCAAHTGEPGFGRPTKLTPDLADAIHATIRQGQPQSVSARVNGVSETSFHSWRERGEADLEAERPTVFAYFAAGLAPARAEAEQFLVNRARLFTFDDPRMVQWLLERIAPERWGKRDKVDVTLNERSKPRTVVPESTSQRDEITEILAAVTAPPAGAQPQE